MCRVVNMLVLQRWWGTVLFPLMSDGVFVHLSYISVCCWPGIFTTRNVLFDCLRTLRCGVVPLMQRNFCSWFIGTLRPHLCKRCNIPYIGTCMYVCMYVSTLTGDICWTISTWATEHHLGPILNILKVPFLCFFLSFCLSSNLQPFWNRIWALVWSGDTGVCVERQGMGGYREQLWFCTKYFCCDTVYVKSKKFTVVLKKKKVCGISCCK